MKKLLIVTHITFWRKDSGDAARLYALARYLSEVTQLTVVFGGDIVPTDFPTIGQIKKRMRFIWIKGYGDRKKSFEQSFATFFSSHQFDVCIIEHVFLSFLIAFMPRDIKMILDAHDIVSDRMESFKKMNCEVRLITDLPAELENAYFREFDVVMMIQKNDFDKISKIIGKEKTILAPHPVSMQKVMIRERVNAIGFVGSAHPPNIDAVNWFLDHVWPLVEQRGVTFHIYGEVCGSLKKREISSVVMNGYVADQDLIYQGLDIIVNPVRYGAGLKIKNVEALGSGLPLVTTTHGAIGMESGINHSFLAADDQASFSRYILNLIDDYDMRKNLGEKAYEYALNNYSPEECFKSLLLEINKPKVFAL
jgi:hypothetical protein